jgi:hypothetical protein
MNKECILKKKGQRYLNFTVQAVYDEPDPRLTSRTELPIIPWDQYIDAALLTMPLINKELCAIIEQTELEVMKQYGYMEQQLTKK